MLVGESPAVSLSPGTRGRSNHKLNFVLINKPFVLLGLTEEIREAQGVGVESPAPGAFNEVGNDCLLISVTTTATTASEEARMRLELSN